MKATHLDNIIAAVKDHIIEALAYFYEAAQIGDNPLELKTPISYPDKEGVNLITGIEMMFDENPKGEMNYLKQYENEEAVTKFPLRLLSVVILMELLKAYETQMCCYYEPVIEIDRIKLSA